MAEEIKILPISFHSSSSMSPMLLIDETLLVLGILCIFCIFCIAAFLITGTPRGTSNVFPPVIFRFEWLINTFFGLTNSKQCCGSGMLITDPNYFHPGSRIWIFPSRIPDPHQIIILIQKRFLSFGNMIWVVHPWSRCLLLPISDSGSRI